MGCNPKYENAAMDIADRIARYGQKCLVYLDKKGKARCSPESSERSVRDAERYGTIVGYYTPMASDTMICEDIQWAVSNAKD